METIGPYRLGEKIGAGGMGVVYRAIDTALERTVALKLLKTDGERTFPSGAFPATTSANATIGASGTTQDFEITGRIDEVRATTLVRTADHVRVDAASRANSLVAVGVVEP